MYESRETDIAPRHTVESLYRSKLEMLAMLSDLNAMDRNLEAAFRGIDSYVPYRIDFNYRNVAKNREEKYVDRACWRYLASLFFLERYMLCTDFERMTKEIDEFKTPVFTVENANAWLAGLKGLINDNVRTLVKQVYRNVIDGTYRTGSSWRAPTKKRNNNGVDKRFILRTGDWSSLFGYWTSKPTITDDLEKVCYLLDGKTIPEKTAKATMKEAKSEAYECAYFSLKVCQNGNTHYVLSDDTRDRLNRYGPEGATIGENIKIKIVPDRWAV